MRQTIANINERQRHQRLFETKIAEWQARTVSQFIAATVPGKDGAKLAAHAEKIKLRMENEKGVADDDRSIEQVIDEGSVVAENRRGSYEALVAGFR